MGYLTKIGIPSPEVMAPFVGGCEIACGVLFLLLMDAGPGIEYAPGETCARGGKKRMAASSAEIVICSRNRTH